MLRFGTIKATTVSVNRVKFTDLIIKLIVKITNHNNIMITNNSLKTIRIQILFCLNLVIDNKSMSTMRSVLTALELMKLHRHKKNLISAQNAKQKLNGTPVSPVSFVHSVNWLN